jgi:hypothetical protein
MSSRRIILGLVLLSAALTPAVAAEWTALASASDHAQDPLILQAMESGDFETRVQLCVGVGKRADPFAGAIIESILTHDRGVKGFQSELLLRMLLGSLFDASWGDGGIRTRVEANVTALVDLYDRIAEWKDPQLTGILVRLLPFMKGYDVDPPLMQIGARLVDGLTRSRGVITSQEIALALDYLASVERMPSLDFLDQCVSIAELSREKILVDRARSVAAVLMSQGTYRKQ